MLNRKGRAGLALFSLLPLALVGCGGSGHRKAISAPSRTLQSLEISANSRYSYMGIPATDKGASLQFEAVATYTDTTTEDVSAKVAWTAKPASSSYGCSVDPSGLFSWSMGSATPDAATAEVSATYKGSPSNKVSVHNFGH